MARKTLKLGRKLTPEEIERTIEEATDESIEDILTSPRNKSKAPDKRGGPE